MTVDLAAYDMDRSPELQSLPVRVTSLQPGEVEVLEFQPTTVSVALDQLAERAVRVEVDTGNVPEGLAIGTPRTSHEEVTASGPESQLGRVDHAVARVQIFDSGIDVRQPQVPLVPVDIDGREVESVELEPATIQVEIDVRAVETSKTVPIRAVLTGNPADGFQVNAVTVEPAVVTIFGAPDAVEEVTEVTTEPLCRRRRQCGPRARRDARPARWHPAPPRTRPRRWSASASARRSRPAPIWSASSARERPTAPPACRSRRSSRSRCSGPAAALADLDPADLTPTLDVVRASAPGNHDLTPTFSLPNGVDLVSVSPGSVTVQIVPPATPTPAPG